MSQNLIQQYAHSEEEFPILARQTHKVLIDKKVVNQRININENLMHYVQDTALLISEIDGSLEGEQSEAFDHIVYLDKSARPVSWLVNLFWNEFVSEDKDGNKKKRPKHSYINIDRAPWFRNVGINVNDDGRIKENGELATYNDFVHNISNLQDRHLAEIRALYVENGIEEENVEYILGRQTILDGKRVLIVDEVSRTGSTLKIAEDLFRKAFPNAKEIKGTYFWHPSEPLLKVGNETVMTSLPVWYDPNTLEGRGIGGLDPHYYRKKFDHYRVMMGIFPHIEINKLRAHAFASGVFSAPLLHEDGSVLTLDEEQVTRKLCADLVRLYDDYKEGTIFFLPPSEWRRKKREAYISAIEKQGVKIIHPGDSEQKQKEIKGDPLYFLSFIEELKTYR